MQHFWLQDNLSKGEVSEVRGWIPQPGTKGDLQCSELLQWDKVGLLFFRGNSSLVCFSTPQSAHWVTFLNSGCSEHTLLTVHLRRSAQNIFFEISWEEELHWSFSECFIFILEFKKKSNNCGKMFANQEMGRFIERSMGKVRKEERMESARWRFWKSFFKF